MDSLFEILLRVDPSCIFDCILVSRDWLQVITGPFFRRTYLNRWEKTPKLLLGFFVLEYVYLKNPKIQLLPAANIGRAINARISSNSNPNIGCFVCKSPENSLVLSVVRPSNTFYVFDPISRSASNVVFQLPPAPAPERYKNALMANIISEDPLINNNPFSFKVILAEANTLSIYPQKDTLIIHTFRSSTGSWEKSTFACSARFALLPITGIDAGTEANGVIYWPAIRGRSSCVAVFDSNDNNLAGGRNIRLIAAPENASYGFNIHYSVSPEGALRCFSRRADTYVDENAWELGKIDIWGFEDDMKDWKLLNSESLNSIWAKNSGVLGTVFEVRPPRPFCFVSFVKGRSDSIFVGLEKQLFVYTFDTQKLEKICVGGFDDRLKSFSRFEYGTGFRPLTMSEVGIWPSSPASLHIPLYY